MFESFKEKRAIRKDLRNGWGDLEQTRQEQGGGLDPTTLHQRKLLGVFFLTAAELPFDYEDPTTGVSWRRGDPYLDISIPPLGRHSLTLEDIQESHKLTAQYIGLNGLHAYTEMKVVGSRTNDRFAKVGARALGFNIAHVADSEYPEGFLEHSKLVYDRHVKHGPNAPEFKSAFVYQTGEQILQHYAASDPSFTEMLVNPQKPVVDYIPGLSKPLY
ncbi:MAG TPA: hypothetical protein VD735_03580 [Candidatus Saccharimonadales bacterium]|nr:hypothetical protein [Candidatus Saccharimonadales bacterium]